MASSLLLPLLLERGQDRLGKGGVAGDEARRQAHAFALEGRREALRRDRAQLPGSGRGAVHAERRGHLDRDAAGLRAGAARDSVGALHDAALEQAACLRRSEQGEHALAAGGLAEDRHVAGIAAEGGDVVAYPLQRGDLVEQAEIRVVA